MSYTCNNCKKDAVIEWLPGTTDGDAELWCFGCFIDNYAALDGNLVVRERKPRDAYGPHGQLAGEIIKEVSPA